MKYVIALSLSFAILTGCKSTEGLAPVSQIKPGVAKEGTLANVKLISDAKAGLEKVVGTTVNDSELLKFVIQQPVGEVGSRSWREMWIVNKSNESTQFLITFKEVGLGAADFEIQKMNDKTANKDCPSKPGHFEKGNDTSQFIENCLGKPNNIDKNPDGRYIYFYYFPDGLILTYLFGENDKLTKINAYQDNNVK